MQENTLKYNNQIEYDGNAYIDEKSMPVENYSDLSNFSRSEIFDDMRVTVISDETMHGDLTHYIFKDEKWEIDDLTAEIYDGNFITFTALEDNSSIGLAKISTNQTLEYSTNAQTWTNFTTTVTVPLNSGQSAFVRGILSGDNTNSDYTKFTMSGKIKASGNINTIWSYTEPDVPLKKYCGLYLFGSCKSLIDISDLRFPAIELSEGCYYCIFQLCGITSVPKKLLPAIVMKPYCYAGMFDRCSDLIITPELPATTLSEYCYWCMYGGCTSLTTIPELPATNLNGANYCYEAMFSGCTSLETINSNILPATTLSEYCYWGMFMGCTSLESIYSLPAFNLTEGCYCVMFWHCTSLNYIKCFATDISANYCTSNWVDDVASSGTFIKHPNATSWSRGIHGIPSNWTVQDDGN